MGLLPYYCHWLWMRNRQLIPAGIGAGSSEWIQPLLPINRMGLSAEGRTSALRLWGEEELCMSRAAQICSVVHWWCGAECGLGQRTGRWTDCLWSFLMWSWGEGIKTGHSVTTKKLRLQLLCSSAAVQPFCPCRVWWKSLWICLKHRPLL